MHLHMDHLVMWQEANCRPKPEKYNYIVKQPAVSHLRWGRFWLQRICGGSDGMQLLVLVSLWKWDFNTFCVTLSSSSNAEIKVVKVNNVWQVSWGVLAPSGTRRIDINYQLRLRSLDIITFWFIYYDISCDIIYCQVKHRIPIFVHHLAICYRCRLHI